MEIITNESGLITINATLFFQLISFLIFLFIINRIMFRPLQNTMLERDMYIAKAQHDITDAEKEIEKINRQLKQQENKTRADANKFRENIESAGTQEAEKIFASAREDIALLKAKTNQEIDEQIALAKKDFAKESEVLALTIMEKILDRRLT